MVAAEPMCELMIRSVEAEYGFFKITPPTSPVVQLTETLSFSHKSTSMAKG